MAKRRANGEGGLYKKKNGTWEGRFTIGYDENGKQKFKSVFGKTQAEAKEKLKKAIEESKGIDYAKSQQYTVAEWLRVWMEVYAKPSVRESTYDYYNNFIENHIIPHIGNVKLNQLTSLQIQKMYNELKTNGRVQRYTKKLEPTLSNRSVRGIHMVLHNALEQAIKERLISQNPCDGCRIPPKDKTEMKVLSGEQVGAYLTEADKLGVLPMFYLELTSGLRRGELLALLWSDLDEETGTISVTKSMDRFHGELVVSEPKTKNSIRKVVVPQQTVELLRQEHARHPDNPYMFPSPLTGDMRDPDAVGRIHKKILKQAGLEHIRFHDLRHTFATLALQNGVDIKTLSNILGHYSAGFTLDTYTHVTIKMQQEAAEKMGNFMQGIS